MTASTAARRLRRLAPRTHALLAALPRPAAVYLVSVAVAGGSAFVWSLWQVPPMLAGWRDQLVRPLLALALLIVALGLGLRPVRLGAGEKVHLGAAPLFAAALLFPPVVAAALTYIATLAHNLLLRRRGGNALFNAAQQLFTVLAAAACLRLLTFPAAAIEPPLAGPAAPLAAGICYFLVNTALAGAMSSLAQRAAWPATLWRLGRQVGWHFLGLLTLGWFAALAASTALWSLPLLAIPIMLSYRLDRTLGDLLATRQHLATALERQRQFVGDVAHELGTPLTSVAGNAAVLLGDPAAPVALREPLEDIQAEATRAAKLLDDLLLLSTVEEGSRLEQSEVAICGVAERAARVCRAAAQTKGITLELTCGDDGLVTGVPTLLEQLALNLLDNAVKYTAAGGRVIISVSRPHGQVELAVEDNGIGIAPEQLERVFDRFYQAEKSDSRGRGGAGLGLAIARRIAEVHGGSVIATSEPGAGSRFVIALPARDQPGRLRPW